MDTENQLQSAGEPVELSTPDEQDVPPAHILPSIVFAQFAGTSLWFAGNAVLTDFSEEFNLPDSALSTLTSAVQLGFIVGTLVLAVTNLVDRYLPTRIFCLSAFFGALTTAIIPHVVGGFAGMFILRFLTGMSLAGIYPVGMKIAADWYHRGLGRALGLLLGALGAGTAFPFLLRQLSQSWSWLLYETAILATLGGLLMLTAVGNGPYRQQAQKFDPTLVFRVFAGPAFRAAAFGYFGHMWELYAFWTWCPVVWNSYLDSIGNRSWDASLVTFCVLSMSVFGCVLGGFLSVRFGSGRVALVALTISGLCCVLLPLFYMISSPSVVLCFYLLWGATVAADSPQFSSLVAQSIDADKKGTGLTVVTCIGFSVSIASIQLLDVSIPSDYLFLLLVPGPLYGCWNMRHFFCSPEGMST